MNKNLVVILLISLFASGCTLGKSSAGIIVKSQPTGTVYVNDKEVGKTPYEDKTLQPGNYTVKISSDNGEWTSNKFRILENTIYNINRELALNSVDQAGENVSIEKGKGITIVTIPSQVEVSLDGQKQGNTPYLIPTVSEGDHQISLTKEGYVPRKIKIRVRSDYKIVIESQLKRESSAIASPSATPIASESASPTPSSSAKATASPKATATPKATVQPSASGSAIPRTSPGANTVTILSTPTGWLRVRDKAGIEGQEIAKVNTNETYPYTEQLDTGWTKITLTDGTEGYVASRYVKVNK